MIDEIKKLPLKEIQDRYCSYLKELGLKKNTIQTARNDAFYLYKNDNTIDFWELIESSSFENLAYEHLQLTLSKYSKGKVESNINGYMSQIRKFRKFVYDYDDKDIPIENVEPVEVASVKEELEHNSRNVPVPTAEEVEKYLKSWDNLESYRLQEDALNKLFFELVPTNTDISDILVKAATLNDFYSTHIFSIFPVAKHILSLNIDDRLNIGDETLVEDIKDVVINDKNIQLYSFATKYCSHHNPEKFPIYDSYVHEVLCYLRKIDGFSKFKKSDLKNYVKFKSVLCDFQKYYELERYSLKELDKYLWQLGKTYFPKEYKKKS